MKKKIVSLCLVAALALCVMVGGTVAYLTDTDFDQNVMTVGNVDIEQIEVFDKENATMMPGVYTQKQVTVKNIGNSEAYIRTIFAFEDTQDAAANVHYCVESVNSGKAFSFPEADTNNDGKSDDWLQIKVTDNNGKETVYTVGYYTYGDAKFASGATTPVSLYDIGVIEDADNSFYDKVGDKYDVLILSQAVQTAGFNDANGAWTNTFGLLDVDSDELVAGWFQEVLGEEYLVVAYE